MILYPIGSTQACVCAASRLKQHGAALVDHPTPEVTHLLLDIPSFDGLGRLRGGGELQPVLERLPASITVIGGNLKHPALKDYQTLDLLQDAGYLAENAAITADCALRAAAPALKHAFRQCPTLVIGWGRIGKCLAQLLRAIGTPVTVAARKETDRAMIRALGYDALDIPDISERINKFRLLFNTVPETVLSQEPPRECTAVELASRNGIIGKNVIIARGLPGKYAPESSGQLIAETILHYYNKEETL